jgi:hypothetical protein
LLGNQGSTVQEVDQEHGMARYKFTAYFENGVLRKRPYPMERMVHTGPKNPIRSES